MSTHSLSDALYPATAYMRTAKPTQPTLFRFIRRLSETNMQVAQLLLFNRSWSRHHNAGCRLGFRKRDDFAN